MSLRTRIFLLTALIVAASVTLAAWLIQKQVTRTMRAEAEKDLGITADAIESFALARRENRSLQASILARSEPLLSSLADGEPAAVQQALDRLQEPFTKLDLIAVLDLEGQVIAAVGPALNGHPVADLPAPEVPPIGSALSAEAADRPSAETLFHGIWILDEEVVELVASPVLAEEPRGIVLLGTRLSSALAHRLQRLSKSHVIILADDRIVGTSMLEPLAQRVVADFPEPTQPPGTGMISEPRQIQIGGIPYLAQLSRVPVDYGGYYCNHIVLSSLQDSMALASGIQRSLMLIGLGALAIAFVAAWLGARRLALPLHQLAETMARIARSGELERPSAIAGGREVTLFQDAFHRMLEAIEESQRDREHSYVEAVGAVMAAVDRRDQESAGHSYRVAYYAVILAQELGFSGVELRALEWGALLHDVGKIAVPDSILRKSGPLTEKEWQIMRQHPSWGYEMLADVTFLRPALDIVYNHHERWDGTGYPRALEGEQIPLSARIFSLVDTYDALTSDRHYRRACSHEAALEELQRVAGSQLDPTVVDAFLKIPYDELQRLRRLSYERISVQRTPPPLADLLGAARTGTLG